jgi:prophage DNA circulation protein
MSSSRYKNIQKGSFRGAQFETFDAEVTFGRRNVLHEYPLKDEPFAEDLGRKAREYTFNAYVIGKNLYNARNALIRAIEDTDTPGVLKHPTLGSILAIPKDCRTTFNNKEGGLEYFTITFVEAGSHTSPTTVNTAYASSFAASKGIIKLSSHFASTFVTQNLPDFLHASALEKLVGNPSNVSTGNNGSFISLVNSILASGNFGSTNDDFTALKEKLTKFAISATDDLDDPTTLALNITNIIVNLSDVFLNQQIEINSEATFISTVMPNHPELSALEAQKRLQGFGALFVDIPLTTDLRIQETTNQEQLINLILHCSLCEMIRITSTMDFPSRQDAIEIRDAVDDYLSPRLVMLADDGEDDTYIALNSARSAMIKDVNTRAATLKNKKYVRILEPVPAIVFAYDQYEDATQDIDIIRRNRIRNPCFIPQAIDVEVLV